MITYNGLIKLGFDPSEFKLSNSVASNRQTYISYWGSNKPEPSIEEIEQAEQVYIAEAQAKEEAREAIRASAMRKLVENAGLTVEEVKSFIKIEE
jgi:hypothetical protein